MSTVPCPALHRAALHVKETQKRKSLEATLPWMMALAVACHSDLQACPSPIARFAGRQICSTSKVSDEESLISTPYRLGSYYPRPLRKCTSAGVVGSSSFLNMRKGGAEEDKGRGRGCGRI